MTAMPIELRVNPDATERVVLPIKGNCVATSTIGPTLLLQPAPKDTAVGGHVDRSRANPHDGAGVLKNAATSTSPLPASATASASVQPESADHNEPFQRAIPLVLVTPHAELDMPP